MSLPVGHQSGDDFSGLFGSYSSFRAILEKKECCWGRCWGVTGVAHFITGHEQIYSSRVCCFPFDFFFVLLYFYYYYFFEVAHALRGSNKSEHIYDKRDDFSFPIVKFSIAGSSSPSASALRVYVLVSSLSNSLFQLSRLS